MATLAVTAMDWGQDCPAPAKINRFLHVIARLPDGYHRLQSVFRLIDLCDRLRFFPRRDGRIRLISTHDGIDADNDLASRAARLLQQRFDLSVGVDIEIVKTIPMGAGLGGGSSNAATTLIALNALWGVHASRSTLQALGRTLGADVPFFIFGQDAFADGVGDILEPVDLSPKYYFLLFPPVSVSRAMVFGDPALPRSTPPIEAADYRSGFGVNDLTEVVILRFPVVAEHLQWLSRFGDARMTGSGSTLFIECDSESEARAIFERKPPGYRAAIVSTLSRHPLIGLVEGSGSEPSPVPVR